MKPVVLLLCLTCAAAQSGEVLRIESSLDCMGTTITVVAYDEDRVRLQSAVEQAFEEARRLDNLLSNYKPRSEWSKVNREAAGGPVRVSPELFEILEKCMVYSRRSEGTFDITVGPLVRVWGFYKGTGRLPHRAEIRTVIGRVGYRQVILNKEDMTVRFARQGVQIDPGGIGKGYAVDKMVEVLRENGIRSALVNAGGSSIYGLGAPPKEKGWRVEIRHPREAGKRVEELHLNNLSMSTSGNSEKFFVAGGRVYSHVFDPRTGWPAKGMLSASVVAPKTLDSEAWTKPYFIMGRQWAARNRQEGFQVYLCEDKLELACAWLQ